MTTRATLRSKGRPGWTIALKDSAAQPYTIGRHPSCSLVLTDMHISSKHLSLLCDDTAENVVITDTSSNGTWFDGEKLDKNEPYAVMYAEQSVHEIVLPCDNPKKNDYTFVLTIGPKLDDGKATAKHSFDSLPREAEGDVSAAHNSLVQFWDEELVKLQDELIHSSCRVAASAYALEDAEIADQGSRSNLSASVLSAASKTIITLKETNVNCLLIAREILDALKQVQSRVVLNSNVEEPDKKNILEGVPIDAYEKLLLETFRQIDPSARYTPQDPGS